MTQVEAAWALIPGRTHGRAWRAIVAFDRRDDRARVALPGPWHLANIEQPAAFSRAPASFPTRPFE